MNMEDEGYGQETDDWMDVEERKEFINFDETPGAITILFQGKPTKQRSKYGKDQYWFPVNLVMSQDPVMLKEHILSTASRRLRAEIKKMVEKYGDKVLGGKMAFTLHWDGKGMDRQYNIGPISEESTAVLLESA